MKPQVGIRTLSVLAAVPLGLLALVCSPGCGSSSAPTPQLVSISVTPPNQSIAQGSKLQFTALGTFSDGSIQGLGGKAVWSSSNQSVATINMTSGLATAVSPGTTSIMAAVGSINNATMLMVTSTSSVTVSPGFSSLTFTQMQQFQATVNSDPGEGVNWSVDGIAGGNAQVGTISLAGLYLPPSQTGPHTITATDQDDSNKSGTAAVVITDFPGMFTSHNDLARTGQNLQENVLTPANVNPLLFGLLFSDPVDGYVYAQPLYIENVSIPGRGFHNVVYVATEGDSIYAFDADHAGLPLWHDSFVDPAQGVTTVPSTDIKPNYTDLIPQIGITGTPVIDPVSGTLYVVAVTKEVSNGVASYFHRLHALDITTGAEKFGGPIVITASVPGTGEGSSNGQVTLDPLMHLQRPGLALVNGTVYLGFGSHGDIQPYHGWILGYDAATLTQTSVFNATPNGNEGAIWQAGGAPAFDAAGNLYAMTGNGTFDANLGGLGNVDYGDTFLKLFPNGASLGVSDYLTPSDQNNLNMQDLDLGSGGPLLLPDQPSTFPHLLVGAGKDGTIYVVNRDDMGQFQSGNNTKIVQALTQALGGNFSTPAYCQNQVYFLASGDVLKTFTLANGLLSTSPTSQSSTVFGFPGATPSVSANGATNAIIWVLQTDSFSNTSGTAVLHAYDATNVATELFDSNQSGTRDFPGPAVKFTLPTVANGKVYVGTQTQVSVFGILPQ
jgi:hypothetical protein